ncbi:MAG: MBOAT family protein, partial [Chitinophagaceae bacterium]|nr:MBOAT family protein [Rubrivivax sp.]
MLFNSATFLFGFLPLTLIGFFLIGRERPAWAVAWLLAASLFFYGWWNPAWLPLLLASMAFNLMAGRAIAEGSRERRRWLQPRTLLVAAIVANLALLLHFKYMAFASGALAALFGLNWQPAERELPLGISFFTFTQIAFLVDVYLRKVADFNPLRYGLFVTYYPHLIAGPILHHAEIMPQFARRDIFRFDASRFADGCVYFTLGLFKKVVLADQFARYANPAFGAAATTDPSFFVSWCAALSYTLQLYFDFSGYCDMAIGLAMMIGVRLPLNFHSPYKARNIADFWRRWHMTLSRFLRDYLYIPLGGNRRGRFRRHVNLALTMLLGGAWHGAGWTFLLWGALHGAYMVAHGLWHAALKRWAPAWAFSGVPGLRRLAWPLTF